jgi:hypothetical protein
LRKKIQIVLLFALVVATARAGYILYQRHSASVEPAHKQAPPLNPDYYVTPKKLYPYDLKSAHQLTEQPVWVKAGYSIRYYPYDRASRRVDFGHNAGLLLPLEKLDIKDVITAASPGSGSERQVMATFVKDGQSYAFPIGVSRNGDYKFYSDDMLFIQDPHELYKHWPADVWQAIDQHQVKPGMNELQAGFAVGMGTPAGSSATPGDRTVSYPDGGKPLSVTFQNGKAVEIKPGS